MPKLTMLGILAGFCLATVSCADDSIDLSPQLAFDDAEPDWQPDWFSDGTRLVFARGPGDPLDLYIASLEDGEITPLLMGAGRDEQPKWRPSGR